MIKKKKEKEEVFLVKDNNYSDLTSRRCSHDHMFLIVDLLIKQNKIKASHQPKLMLY